MATSIADLNPKQLLDFRDPISVQTAWQQAEIACASFGSNDQRCLGLKKIATDIQKLHMCSKRWNANCGNYILSMKNEYNLDFRPNCDRGYYNHSDPHFKNFICSQGVNEATHAMFPTPWNSRTQQQVANYVSTGRRGDMGLQHGYNQNRSMYATIDSAWSGGRW
jgi:hypothetical protein